MREAHHAGPDYLRAATTLLQRVRNADPSAGLYEAAEIHWWWGVERSTDNVSQLFWYDEHDQPVAAVFVNDFGNRSSAVYEDPMMVVVVMPDSSSDWVAEVVERGLAHFGQLGIGGVELEVDPTDDIMVETLSAHGFSRKGDAIVEGSMEAANRPEISSLHDGYRLFSRRDTTAHAHHMADERRPEIEPRLQQGSLYRPDLDLVVLADDGDVAGYGLFWYDPETAMGVVEPMRTADAHQQRGLARHILTSGINLLVAAGAERISVCFEPDNPAAGRLYTSVGFEPHRRTAMFGGTIEPSPA